MKYILPSKTYFSIITLLNIFITISIRNRPIINLLFYTENKKSDIVLYLDLKLNAKKGHKLHQITK